MSVTDNLWSRAEGNWLPTLWNSYQRVAGSIFQVYQKVDNNLWNI